MDFKIQELKKYYLNLYHAECKQSSSIRKPLHLFSFYTFVAYHNIWVLINRKTLTEGELSIINQIGCYKETRKEIRKKYINAKQNSVSIQV
jgi:hypothetical protein